MAMTKQEAMRAQGAIDRDLVPAIALELAAFRRLLGSAAVAMRVAPTTCPLASYWLALEVAAATLRDEPVQVSQLMALGPPVIPASVIGASITQLRGAEVIGTLSGSSEGPHSSLALGHRAAAFLGNRALTTARLLRGLSESVRLQA